MIDQDGFRYNIGIILTNAKGDVFWGKRVGQSSWQFPQGGVNEGETPEQAMYRELQEEIGLPQDAVTILACTDEWMRYLIPEHLIRYHQKPVCKGQQQKWFLLRLNPGPFQIRFDQGDKAEFDAWRWVDYWHPLTDIVDFKKGVYEQALTALAPTLGK